MANTPARSTKEEALDRIFRRVPVAAHSFHLGVDRAVSFLSNMSLEYGGTLDLNPDFQRGHVWNEAQQRAFVLALLRGSLSSSALLLQFNCANWDTFSEKTDSDLPLGLQCLDGLQRLTAMSCFLDGNLAIEGFTFDDLVGTPYDIARRRLVFNVEFYAYRYKRDVLEHYLAFNSGGSVHSNEEISRVRAMLEAIAPVTLSGGVCRVQ